MIDDVVFEEMKCSLYCHHPVQLCEMSASGANKW